MIVQSMLLNVIKKGFVFFDISIIERMNKMKYLGFYLGGHDSNVSLVDEDGTVRYFKLERLIQSKHKKGDINWILQICKNEDFVPNMICFSDGNRNKLGICSYGQVWQEVAPFSWFPDAKTYCIDHHYAHVLSAWPVIGENEKFNYGVCVDGRGDHQIKCSIITKPFDIWKACYSYSSLDDEFCLMFNKIGKLMNLCGGELDFAGKIMGAHAYGEINLAYINQCEDYANKNGIGETLNMMYEGVAISELCYSTGKQFYDWLASYHFWIEKRICNILKENIKDSSLPIIYSGGGAQNTVYNNHFSELYDMRIPPHCYDGGISLGCVKFLSILNDSKITIKGFPFCQGEEDLGYASEKTIEKVAELLADGKIVGWCQGRSEIGPRALGHRSILMNPAITNGKEIMNCRIKKREEWRPFAASILYDDVRNITGKEVSLDYMLHAVKVIPKFQRDLISVTHVDETCRFQTVKDTKELHSFYKLIKNFKDKTGVVGVLNTSYNASGMPIAYSRHDILLAFSSLDLDALCIGDELIVRSDFFGRISE